MDEASVTMDIENSSYIASCPWHSYDFDLETGKSAHGVKACTYKVLEERGKLVLIHPDANVNLMYMKPVRDRFEPSREQRHIQNKSTQALERLPEDASLCECCALILNTADPEQKIALTSALYERFTSLELDNPMPIGHAVPPDEPPRQNLQIIEPGQMPRLGKAGNDKSKIAMLHSLANIEQWAIDLALDVCVRFADFKTDSNPPQALPRTFFHDWLKVANDEAKHFSLLRGRLQQLGSYFGALPVHNGLWESASCTAHDIRARISVVALVHEARGLDVNPMTIEKFRKSGDSISVEALTTIHHDEITHVTTGHRWLTWICQQEGIDPVVVFRDRVKKFFRGSIKPPFNEQARIAAGLTEKYYADLDGRPKHILQAGG